MLRLDSVAAAIVAMTLVTYLIRGVPFVFFARRTPPPLLLFVERFLPPMVMMILVLYALRDAGWSVPPYGIPTAAGVAATLVLHLALRNVLVSIAGGTMLHMLLVQTAWLDRLFLP